VGEVLRVIEGSSGLRLSSREEEGPLSDLWRQVDEAVTSVLDRTTFADLVHAWRDKQAQAAPYWEI
jgi:DNA-binding IscR family transcriptional regulator